MPLLSEEKDHRKNSSRIEVVSFISKRLYRRASVFGDSFLGVEEEMRKPMLSAIKNPLTSKV